MIERKIVKALPSSFVASNMKLAADRGSGEAKLWVGQMSNAAELDAFFSFDSDYTYSFSRENFLEYLNQLKFEYVYQKFNSYKAASLDAWNENYNQIKSLPDTDFSMHLYKFTDTSRYYVRADEDIFKRIFRKIAIPKLTNVIFIKDTDDKTVTLTLELNLDYENATDENGNIVTDEPVDEGADNILLYGVPGCGKSYTIKTEYCDDDEHMERAVFHPDYTYSDFVGQILPRVDEGHIEYRFEPGPFTRILKKAVETPGESFYLVVEEINRGNAPAIFGDIFQLLDRDESGCSEYGVSNENISNHVYGDATTKIKIPGNLFVLATMNTSDQNVFTLDTAFKRRWAMRMIENNIDACEYADYQICAWGITWGTFARTINQKIIELGENNLSNEDNRLGAYFVREADLNDAGRFGEKILMYLWNDAFKFDHDKVFKAEYRTLDELITGFVRVGFAVFSDDIVFETIAEETDDIVETDNPTAEQYLEGKNPELVAAYRTLFEAVTARISNAYDASVGSLTYAAWKANDIRKASFADIVIQRNRIVISCEVPVDEAARAVGEQIPVDNHHNHYFRIIFDAAQTEQIVEAIVDSYNQLKVQ